MELVERKEIHDDNKDREVHDFDAHNESSTAHVFLGTKKISPMFWFNITKIVQYDYFELFKVDQNE